MKQIGSDLRPLIPKATVRSQEGSGQVDLPGSHAGLVVWVHEACHLAAGLHQRMLVQERMAEVRNRTSHILFYKMINTSTPLKHTLTALLLGLQVTSAYAQTCNPAIPLTRPDNRYESVANASPAGSEVRDKVTGLIWQRCLQGMNWNGNTCTGTATTHNWQAALDLARTAAASTAATGTASAWRLPNNTELFSLAERACFTPAINSNWFPATSAARVWSASPNYASGSSRVVWFNIGFDTTLDKNNATHVRLVRSGQ